MTRSPVPLVISTGVRQPPDHRSDITCLTRLVRGDRDALADLYDAHAGSLYRHGLALTRQPSDAEDLVQAVFLKLATTGAPLLAVRNPMNYLHRILRTAWIDGRRRSAIAHEAPADAADELRAAGTPASVDAAIDVTRALARLPALQREIVALHLVEGFSRTWRLAAILALGLIVAVEALSEPTPSAGIVAGRSASATVLAVETAAREAGLTAAAVDALTAQAVAAAGQAGARSLNAEVLLGGGSD